MKSTFSVPWIRGETLYSLMSAAFKLSGYRSFYKYKELLFARKNVDPCTLIPRNLGLCLEGLGFCKSEEEWAINNLFLFPYYRPFCSEASMRTRTRLTNKGFKEDARNYFERRANDIANVHFLRYCRACRADQLSHYGRSAWLRDHQLPFVVSCWRHRCPLVTTIIRGYNAFLPQQVVQEVTENDSPDDDSEWLATASKDLLDLNTENVPVRILNVVYRGMFVDMGIKNGGYLNHSELKKALMKTWKAETLEQMTGIFRMPVAALLDSAFGRHLAVKRPILNLLLMRVGCSDVPKFFGEVKTVERLLQRGIAAHTIITFGIRRCETYVN